LILVGSLPPPHGLAATLAAKAYAEQGAKIRKTSARGRAWRSEIMSLPEAACMRALWLISAKLPGPHFWPSSLKRVQWWANVLFDGAAFEEHGHAGQWSFVHHLTRGAAVAFGSERYPAEPGQLLVFPASARHRTEPTEGVRVSIAGNLWFEDPSP
jgi:hypothetical protein